MRFKSYIIKKDKIMLIIDGHDVYEIDEECAKKYKMNQECKILEKLLEKRDEQNQRKNHKICGP